MLNLKRFAFLILLLCLLVGKLFSATTTVNPTEYFKQLNVLYQKGQSREQIGANTSAAAVYNQILTDTIEIINNTNTPLERIIDILPFTISAGYRIGIIAQRVNAASADKLYEQLQSYKQTQKHIEEVLTAIANLQIDRDYRVPKRQYNHLYFARAYNRISWSATLINGNLWKRYFIYMPSDAVLMIDASIRDLKTMFNNYHIKNYQQEGDVFNRLTELMNKIAVGTREEQLTYKLSFYSQKLEHAREIMKKSVGKRSLNTIKLYGTDSIQNSLILAKEFQTIEEYASDAGKPLFFAVAELQKAIGQRSF
ncbi:hypothetical protein ACFL4D_03190 [Candidatus Margulisiibacteriota bacterium]